MQIERLTRMEDWELMWEAQHAEDAGGLLLFKRSPTCPVSFHAERIFENFVTRLPDTKDLRVVSVDVVNARPISQQIARDTRIQHESPQAMLISRGQNIVWHASHGAITEEALEGALAASKT